MQPALLNSCTHTAGSVALISSANVVFKWYCRVVVLNGTVGALELACIWEPLCSSLSCHGAGEMLEAPSEEELAAGSASLVDMDKIKL